MIRRRVLWFTALGLALAAAAGIGMLLWYYRPTVEYAYVDILDPRKDRDASSLLVGVVTVLALSGVALWLWSRRRKPNQNG
jgi:hypothetical protein